MDVVVSSARAPLLEVLRQVIFPLRSLSSEHNFVIIFYISCSWKRGLPLHVVKIWSLMEINVNGYVFILCVLEYVHDELCITALDRYVLMYSAVGACAPHGQIH